MLPIARRALEALWGRADRAATRDCSGACRVHFSVSGFSDYLEIRTLEEKEAFHAEMNVAARVGALHIEWDHRAGAQGAIKYLELLSFPSLTELLGKRATTQKLVDACERLAPWMERRANLQKLIASWEALKSPRGVGVDFVHEVVDACRLLEQCERQQFSDVSQRRVSTRLFGDSKRIERLGTVLDLLTAPGFDKDEARQREAVLASLGLLQYPQPVLVAGNITILAGRSAHEFSSSIPAFPYSGYAPQFLHGAQGQPSYLLSVENLTTFNEIAAELAGPLAGVVIYTGGYASPSMLRAYLCLVDALPSSTPIYHWGDTDLHGFRIARQLAEALQKKGRTLRLWMMGKYVDGCEQAPLSQRDQSLILEICRKWGWGEAGTIVARVGQSLEQELQPLLLPA